MTPRQVLVVETDPKIRRFLSDYLAERECRVDMVENGREAFRLAMSRDYILIIVNVMLPELDGRVIVDSITLVKPAVPVLLVAIVEPTKKTKPEKNASLGVLPLPFKYADLSKALEPIGLN